MVEADEPLVVDAVPAAFVSAVAAAVEHHPDKAAPDVQIAADRRPALAMVAKLVRQRMELAAWTWANGLVVSVLSDRAARAVFRDRDGEGKGQNCR